MQDESTILGFRHLLEQSQLGESLFQAVGKCLQAQALRIARGTIVDVSIIRRPSSTRKKDKARDPQMRSERNGNQWCFGLKALIRVDSKIKQIHSVTTHDSQVQEDLLHGEETRVRGDADYAGQTEVIH